MKQKKKQKGPDINMGSFLYKINDAEQDIYNIPWKKRNIPYRTTKKK